MRNQFIKLICLNLLILDTIFLFFSCNKKTPSHPNTHFNKWHEANEGLDNMQIRDIALHPFNAEEIYIATAQGIFRSDNGAEDWFSKNKNLKSLDIMEIEITSNENKIIASSWGGGIFRSENKGDNWTVINNGLSDPRVFTIFSTNQIYFAGTESGLYKSVNNGELWDKISIPGGGGPTTCISVSSRDLATLYIGIKWKGIYKSTNGGLTWEQNGLNSFSPMSIKVDPINNNRIYMAAGGSGFYVSVDAAENWSPRNSGIENKDVKCLVINDNNTDEVYVGTNQGVFITTDAGLSWKQINDGLTNLDVRAIAIDPKDSKTIYAGTMGGGVFKMILDF